MSGRMLYACAYPQCHDPLPRAGIEGPDGLRYCSRECARLAQYGGV